MASNIKERIMSVIMKLEEQSQLERADKVSSLSGGPMLAITFDTGMFFNIMLKAMNAARILEVGTSAGYSTLWFADALSAQSTKKIFTIEANHEKIKRAGKNFDDAGVKDTIEIIEGDAKKVLSGLQRSYYEDSHMDSKNSLFDFVFLDADKENLIDYFDLVLPMVKVGGIIAADNMLYPEDYRPYMSKYASYVRNKNEVESVTVPIGMGEEISIKLK